jgi:hypothetical protein
MLTPCTSQVGRDVYSRREGYVQKMETNGRWKSKYLILSTTHLKV